VVWKGGVWNKEVVYEGAFNTLRRYRNGMQKKDKNIERFRSPSIKPLKKGESK